MIDGQVAFQIALIFFHQMMAFSIISLPSDIGDLHPSASLSVITSLASFYAALPIATTKKRKLGWKTVGKVQSR